MWEMWIIWGRNDMGWWPGLRGEEELLDSCR